MWSWTVKKAECWRIDAFELWCWRRLLRGPWTARRSNQSILKEINPGISLEGVILKLKLQYFGHLMQRVNSLEKTVYADANYLRLPFENHWNTYSLNLSFTHNWEFFSCIISRIVSVPKSCKDWKPLLSWILPKNLGYLLIRSTSYFWYQFLQTYLSHITMGNEFCLFSVPQYHSTTGAPYISVGWTNMGLQHCQVLRINVAAFHNWNRTLSVLVCSFTIMWQWKKLQTGIGQNHLFPGKHKPCPAACA